jgi:cation/acetate symporter
MAALLLAENTGGRAFLGFIASVAFATILAVVAGLTLSGASTISHDLYVHVVKRGVSDEKGEMKVAKRATIFLGVLAVALGLMFKGQNVAFMVGLAFSIAASANFPALLMSIIWKGFTTKGAVWCMVTGASLALILIVLSPTVMVDIMGYSEAIFPLKNPTIVSMTLAFVVGIIVSLLQPEKEAAELFESEKLRTYLGHGSEK